MTDMIRLGDLFERERVQGVIPSGVIASDSVANSATAYVSPVEYKWNDAKDHFNIQGQKWEPDIRATFFGPQVYGGCRNVNSPRTYSAPQAGIKGNAYQHVTEFEFVFTGTRFSIAHWNSGGNGSGSEYGGDIHVYLEYGGAMWEASALPKVTTRTSGDPSYRNIIFERPYHGRIRVVLCSAAFRGILTDGTSIVAPAPDRFFGIADGDSYFESAQALAADSSTGWFTQGIVDELFRRTGFVWARRAQGATGFFVNGVGIVYDDTVASVTQQVLFITITVSGVSRTMSASRRNWMTQAVDVYAGRGRTFTRHGGEDFGQPLGRRPLVYLLNGTWNDASAGGVTEAQMYARAKTCYQWVQSVDPYCTTVHVSPEPFDDTLFGNAIGTPRVGDKSWTHVQGQMRAAREVPRTHYINAFGPDDPWWTGAGPDNSGGSQGVPTNSQQAQLVSVRDGIHATKRGNDYYAAKIVDAMADIRVPAARVNGLA